MSAESRPTTLAQFAEALKDLPLDTLQLKFLEIGNSIVHLEYSNEQLRPYAEGRETALNSPPGVPDQDAIEGIAENEQVIERNKQRIGLIRVEIESRGHSWAEFSSIASLDSAVAGVRGAPREENNRTVETSGVNGGDTGADASEDGGAANGTRTTGSDPWTDGTFQTGVIRNGEIIMDDVPGQRTSTSQPSGAGGSGGLANYEELLRRMEEQLRTHDDDNDEGGGLHL